MSHESEPTRPRSQDLAFVCWRGGDGARVEGCPMERDRAEALARAYAEFFPRQTYWVEPVPWMERVIPNATRSAPRQSSSSVSRRSESAARRQRRRSATRAER